MSGADSSTGPLAENQTLLTVVGVGALILVLLLAVLGGPGAVGFLGVVVYGVVWLAVVGFALWLLYRLVVAVERIAHAQQRIAAAENPPSGARAPAAEPTTEAETGETTEAKNATVTTEENETTDETEITDGTEKSDDATPD
ncbi:MAG: hypothetical protein ACOCSD_06645 [Halolamina sp.]